MATDYKSTVFLPKTDFPMRAGLPQREPEILAWWKEIDLDRRIREVRAGAEPFILHDGPPYANGHLHIGHALNKILKDLVNRTRHMAGRRTHYVPGWDCHGLPIEWKIEEDYRAKGKDKDAVPIIEFRRECREFADQWIDTQRDEFRRLGVTGDWDNYYTTMTFAAEAQIARELGRFLMDGSLYRGARPVMWSAVEKTALADAEIEYHEHSSTTIHARFPVIRPGHPALDGAAIVIWTTTPWTMAGNRAVACGEAIDYVVIEPVSVAGNSLARPGERLVVARALLEDFRSRCRIEALVEHAGLKGRALAGTLCAHPLRGQGYDYDVPVLAAAFATDDQGTGFVHIAPGHGADDFELGREHGLEVPETVADDGTFHDHVPLFAGMNVLDDNMRIAAIIREHGGLVARGTLKHSYPHSWRSRAPLIFRNTAQWFISMQAGGLRETALKAIAATRFVPAAGQSRLRGMIETRPDWCVSRQRAWGVPLPVFVDRRTGEPLRDQAVLDRVVAAFEAEGADAWFSSPPGRFLGDDRDPEDYEQVTDIADVWFDSGSTHAFVLEGNADLTWPAALYLEGSDQHRGWFHSSLLVGAGTRGRAPYEAVLTHGFINDEQGRKMSKSLGNGVDPFEVIEQNGADILRIWVVSSDFTEDLRVGPGILKHAVDHYRRLRNTLRYVLGALDGWSDGEKLPHDRMPELERWVLHRIAELDAVVRQCTEDFDFHSMFVALHQFCAVDLSAFYFDIRKDSLYCDPPAGDRRRAVRTVMAQLFDCLTAWLAPITCFTAEEAWRARHGGPADSVHLQAYPTIPAGWRDEALAAKWAVMRAVRRVVTGALERERAEKRIGSALQAHPVVHVSADQKAAFEGLDPAEIFITSAATLSAAPAPPGAFALDEVAGVAVVPGLAAGGKCERCWLVLPEVGEAKPLCARCGVAVAALVDAAE